MTLTNQEIYTAYIEAANQTLRPQDERIALAFARAIESAVLSKLAAGVSVEPVHQYLCTKCGSATPVAGTEHYDNPDCSCGYSMFKQPVRFTLEQLNTAIAAARVAAIRDYVETAVSELTGTPYTMPEGTLSALIGAKA